MANDSASQPPVIGNIEEAPKSGSSNLDLPPPWRSNLVAWFAQVEIRFRAANITSESRRFELVAGSLDKDIFESVFDYITMPDPTEPYTKLKERVVNEYADSETQKMKDLLGGMQLGDLKPSRLYAKMKELAKGRVSDQFLKTLFFNQLPANTRSIISAMSELFTLEQLARAADNVFETAEAFSIAAMQSKPSSSIASVGFQPQPENALRDEISAIVSKLDALTTAQNEIRREIRESGARNSRSRSLTPSSSRSCSRSRSQTVRYENCWYHYKYGIAARRCTPPCKMGESLAAKSGN